MEEILASIRRIISDNDDPSAAPAQAAGKGAGAQQTVGDDGVLELTDMVGNDGKVVNLTAAKASANIPEPPALEEPPPMADPTPEPVAKPKPAEPPSLDDIELSAPEPAPKAPRSYIDDDALVGPASAAVSSSAFAALAHQLSRKDDDDLTTGSLSIGSGRTLEDLVKEMIRPMLREWLDANLPGMVERLVKREIERLVRRAED